MKHLITVFLSLTILYTANTQSVIFEKSYDFGDLIFCTSIIGTDDGGFLITGDRRKPDQTFTNILIKTEEHGDTLWTKELKYYSEFYTSKIIKAQDGSYTFCGTIRKTHSSSEDVYVANFDQDGNLNWDNAFSIGFGTFMGMGIRELKAGGYILSVGSPPVTPGSADAGFLVKLNAAGDTLWTRRFDAIPPKNYFLPVDVVETSDGGFVMGGSSGQALRLIKTNSNGKLQWNKHYDHISADAASIVEDSNGDLIICSVTDSIDTTGNDIYLFRVNNEGEMIWNKIIGDSGDDYGFKIIQDAKDNGFIITGMRTPDTSTASYIYFAKLDGGGNIKCENTFGPPNSLGFDITPTSDGNLMIIGFKNLFSVPDVNKIFIAKISNCEISRMEERQRFNTLDIFPNPVAENMQVNLPEGNGNLKLEISDARGKVLKVQELNSSNSTVSIRNLPEGIYFLKAHTRKGEVFTNKIVIRK
ncbi:MAG: T9SS type A sorting domain-containing protein [Bacteroidia bacterium]